MANVSLPRDIVAACPQREKSGKAPSINESWTLPSHRENSPSTFLRILGNFNPSRQSTGTESERSPNGVGEQSASSRRVVARFAVSCDVSIDRTGQLLATPIVGDVRDKISRNFRRPHGRSKSPLVSKNTSAPSSRESDGDGCHYFAMDESFHRAKCARCLLRSTRVSSRYGYLLMFRFASGGPNSDSLYSIVSPYMPCACLCTCLEDCTSYPVNFPIFSARLDLWID